MIDKRSPLVSVCIPNYNNAPYLKQAVQSALNQTVGDLEVIICDNQSTDNSVAVARSIDDPRVRVYENEANLGIYGNFRRTVELSRGKYLKFLCADDWLEPDYLEKTLPYLDKNPRTGLVTTKQAIITDEGNLIGYRDVPVVGKIYYTTEEYLDASLRRNNPIGNPTRVIVPHAVYDDVGGFDADNEFSGDLDLWLRIVARYDIAALPDVLCYERKHPQQRTHFHARDASALRYVCMAFERSFDTLPDYWTPKRRKELCRVGLAPGVHKGFEALFIGKFWYWREVA